MPGPRPGSRTGSWPGPPGPGVLPSSFVELRRAAGPSCPGPGAVLDARMTKEDDMVRRVAASLVMALGGAVLLGMVTVAPALAHEERTVVKFHVAVGFGDEPAYAGQKNSVQMFLHDAKD